MNPKILSYVRNSLEKGKDRNQITAGLLNAGVSQQEIDAAFKSAGKGRDSLESALDAMEKDELVTETNPSKPAESNMKMIAVAVVAVIILSAVLVVPIVGIVMWQLGVFNMGSGSSGSHAYTTATGFSKIKPQLAGTGTSSSGEFTGVFTNGVGTWINISMSDVKLTSPSGKTCSPREGYTAVLAGDNININANNCQGGSKGDVYTVTVDIPYIVTIGGIKTTHTDTGTLRGPYE